MWANSPYLPPLMEFANKAIIEISISIILMILSIVMLKNCADNNIRSYKKWKWTDHQIGITSCDKIFALIIMFIYIPQKLIIAANDLSSSYHLKIHLTAIYMMITKLQIFCYVIENNLMNYECWLLTLYVLMLLQASYKLSFQQIFKSIIHYLDWLIVLLANWFE